MQINPNIKINQQYIINKREFEEAIRPRNTIKSDDHNRGTHIRPYISVGVCNNLIQQNVLLKTCIETLAKDLIFNDVNIVDINNNEDTVKTDLIKEFWETCQDELCKQVTDYLSYGFGASEVIFTVDNEPDSIAQIQADTLYIKKEIITDEDGINQKELYFAVQQVNGVDNVKMRLLQHLDEYPQTEEMENLPVCFWLGGGRTSDYYDYPYWISAFNHVSASVNLDMLDAQKINDGNLVSGILVIKRPPFNPDEDVDDTLEEKMQEKGNGIFTLELTSMNPDIPLTVDYIQISESNYDYLKELSDKCDSKILALFKIPKARLLIDDTTESMNSNKTNTLYKIYSKELNVQQRPIELLLRQFNKVYFEFAGKVDIKTPIFVDDKDIEANITINLFDKGLITYGQAIKKISSLFPEFEDYLETPIDYNSPIYDERYYNGQPLGLTDPTDVDSDEVAEAEKDMLKVGDLIDYIQIT